MVAILSQYVAEYSVELEAQHILRTALEDLNAETATAANGGTTQDVESDITWTGVVNCTVDGNDIENDGGGSNGYGSSAEELTGDGFIEFGVIGNISTSFVGLSYAPTLGVYADSEYTFFFTGGRVGIIEGGTAIVLSPVPYELEDRLKIVRSGTEVTYYKAGVLIHTSTLPSSGSMVMDANLWSVSPSVVDAVMATSSYIDEDVRVDPENVTIQKDDMPAPQDYPAIRLYTRRGASQAHGGLTAGNESHELVVQLYLNPQAFLVRYGVSHATIQDFLSQKLSKLAQLVTRAIGENLRGSAQVWNVDVSDLTLSRPYPKAQAIKAELVFEVQQRVYDAFGDTAGTPDAVTKLSGVYSAQEAVVEALRTHLGTVITAMNVAIDESDVPSVDPEDISMQVDDDPAPQNYPAIRFSTQRAYHDGTGGSFGELRQQIVVRTFVNTQSLAAKSGVYAPTTQDKLHEDTSKLARAVHLTLSRYLPTLIDCTGFEKNDRDFEKTGSGTSMVQIVEETFQLSQWVMQ